MTPTRNAAWTVVGGGPMGILAVARLLELAPPSARVAWIDAAFGVGRLPTYASVPGNTICGKLERAFLAAEGLNFTTAQGARRAANEGEPDCILGKRALIDTDATQTCGLNLCVDAFHDATTALRLHERVDSYLGEVDALRGDAAGWCASMRGSPGGSRGANDRVVRSAHVLLCTGAAPRPAPASALRVLNEAGVFAAEHDDVVAPARLAGLQRTAPALAGANWVVVGGSHSGVLAAQNLAAAGAARVTVLTRSPLRFAEPRGEEHGDGWVKFDGTGLKGTVAAWARAPPSNVTIEVCGDVLDDAAIARRAVQRGADAAAYCIGFDRIEPAVVEYASRAVALDAAYVARSAHVAGAPRLYGVGLGFPDEWTDPEGRTETRVGFHFTVQQLDRAYAHAARVAGSK